MPIRPSPKKRKLCHPNSASPETWDGLSTTPLTAKALREFDRRSRQLERENAARRELLLRQDYGLRPRRAVTNESEHVDSADRFLQQCSSQSLSRVKKFATHGGPDLRHLRGCQCPPVAGKKIIEATSSSLGSLKRKQGSKSAKNSVTTTNGTYPTPKPDFYDGARPEQLERKILEELSGLVVPSRREDYPIAPNFFMEAKGPEGNQSLADRQIYYDLAAGERAQAALLAYQQSSSDQRSLDRTLGFTYVGGTLKLIAAHINKLLGTKAWLEYVMTKVKAWAMNSDSDTFRKGATAYRNARDWAERQRNEAIRQANKMVRDQTPAADVTKTTWM
ncbi:hypothetical protein NU195Hw_Modified_127t1 [Hortaea werneckii]